jgi:hypothetical protein
VLVAEAGVALAGATSDTVVRLGAFLFDGGTTNMEFWLTFLTLVRMLSEVVTTEGRGVFFSELSVVVLDDILIATGSSFSAFTESSA